MIQILHPNITVLAKIKIFTIKDLWLFLLGIIFISMTSGAIGAFMLGVREEEFFIGEADNILIVTQPGATTPFTGQVPESMQGDIQKIRGVISVSPETLGLCIIQNLNDKTVVVRGITADFSKLTPTQVKAGSWFNPIYYQVNNTQINVTQVNGVMVGYLLASDLGLACGDRIQLAATLTDMVVDVVVTGIIVSNSPCDEEILVSLDLGKTLSAKQSPFVSILRVLIDENIISKNSLFSLLNTEYTVPILIKTRDPKLTNTIMETPIVVYTPYGEHIETKFVEKENRTEFKLQFGTYEFVATPPENPSSIPLTVFVNQSFDTAFEITIGQEFHDLHLNITYNKQPSHEASVFIRRKFKPEESYSLNTSSEGIVHFLNLPEDFYTVYMDYKEIFRQITINLNQSTQIDIELECSLTLNTIDISSGLQVNGGLVKIFKKPYFIEVYNDPNYLSGTPIFLDRGSYQVEFQYNNITRTLSTIVNMSTFETIYVGNATLSVWVRGETGLGLNSANVSAVMYNGKKYQGFTNTTGHCELQLEVDLNYNFEVIPSENQSRVFELPLFFRKSSSIIIDFLTSYRLDIITLNGSMNNIVNNVLSGCNVTIFKGNKRIFSDITNSSGQITINLSEPGVYKVFAEKNGFNWVSDIIIQSSHREYKIKLGKVHLLISAQTVTGSPVLGVRFELWDHFSNETYSDTTNSSGLAELFFPKGKYKLQIYKEGFFSEENVSFSISQYSTIVRIIELGGNVSIRLTNQLYQKIGQAYIVLTNEYYNTEYIGFTNHIGELILYNIPWGNYSVYITYSEEIFPRQILDFVGKSIILDIQIESYVDLNEYGYGQGLTTFSVVLSSEYVSGFLQTTLEIFVTAFTSLIIIISVLSLLSITSVISHPIVSNNKSIKTFRQLGATREQIVFGVVAHLSILGMIASIFGVFSGMWIMTAFPSLQKINIGGVIFRPIIDFWLLLLIVISNLLVIIIKAGQKSNELYSLQFHAT